MRLKAHLVKYTISSSILDKMVRERAKKAGQVLNDCFHLLAFCNQ